MKQKTQNLIQQLVSGALFLAVIVMLGWLSVRFNVKQDWTVNQRNTVSESTRKQLAAMPDTVKFIAFDYPGAESRATVQYFFEQYRRFKDDVELTFIDPSSQPQKVKDYNIDFAGQVVIEYQGRRENLRQISEQLITGALQRLAYSGEKWVLFLEGHGERAVVDAQGESGYSRFANALTEKGLKVQPLNLIKDPTIPDNAAVLVIASPRSALLDGEIKLIDDYVKAGGNLFWMADPDNAPGLDAVATTLGITWQNGFAVFPEYELLGTGHPGIYVALDYPPGPVTRGLTQVTLFPLVRSVTAAGDSGWNAQPMLTSSPGAWLETQPIDGSAGVTLDPQSGDIAGPLTIGMTLTRDVKIDDPAPAADKPDADQTAKPEDAEAEPPKPEATRQQRVVVLGDADFLADSAIGEQGNQQLGLNIVQWLISRDEQLNIDVPKAPDANLFLPDWAMALIGGGFVILLPLLLIGVGVTRWVLRRRR